MRARRGPCPQLLLSALCGALIAPLPPSTIAIDPPRPSSGTCLPCRKAKHAAQDQAVAAPEPEPTFATLVNLHSHVHIPLSETEPSNEVFSAFLQDRVTGTSVPIAPELLTLLRTLTHDETLSRVEIISGYRSWKLNEMLRKKGRNVSSSSQHSLGRALDFRMDGLGSKELAQRIEKLSWKGGLAHYPGDHDRFVHADVGPNRRWRGR